MAQAQRPGGWPFLAPQQAELDDLLLNKLEIRSNSKVSTFAREGVVFPITIRNNLPASSSDPDVNAVHAPADLHLRQPLPADHQTH